MNTNNTRASLNSRFVNSFVTAEGCPGDWLWHKGLGETIIRNYGLKLLQFRQGSG